MWSPHPFALQGQRVAANSCLCGELGIWGGSPGLPPAGEGKAAVEWAGRPKQCGRAEAMQYFVRIREYD